MNYRLFITQFIFTISFSISFSQKSNNFSDILSSNYSLIIKEHKIDSFFCKNIPLVSTLETSNYYHEYGLWYFRSWLKNKDKTSLLKKAISYTNESKILKKSIDTIDPKSLKKTLYNLGYFNFSNNGFFEAIQNYSEVIKTKNPEEQFIYTYNALGETYAKIADFHKALDYLDKAIELSKKSDSNRKKLANAYLYRANVYSLMGYKEYSKEIQRDLFNVDSILNLATFNISEQKNQIHQIEGNRLLQTGKYKESTKYFFKVLERLQPNDSSSLSKVYNSIGLSLLNLKKHKKAQSCLQKSISYDSKFTAPYENLGDLYMKQTEFKKALYQYQKAIHYTISNGQEFTYYDLISKEELELATNKYYLLHHLIQKANGWISYYHHDANKEHLLQALKTFKIADQLVDIIRFESTEYKSKLYWREQSANLYIKAVEVCYLLNKPEDAYYFMEKNKALLLLEDITNEQAKENANIPTSIAKREFELKQAIYLSENNLNTPKNLSQDSIQILKNTIYTHKRTYEKFVDSLDQVFPSYASNKKKIQVLPYATFHKKYVSDDEVVLHYILNDQEGYGILHTVHTPVFFKIKNIDTLQKEIVALREQSAKWFSDQDQLDAHHKTAYQIFRKLIPQQVYDKVKEKNLTIIPDYTLQQISFETLTTSDQKQRFFIEDTEIRYAYSMSYLDQNNQKIRKPTYDFMGLAPVSFTYDTLSTLSLSKEEVRSISELVSGDTLLEEHATKSNFLDTIGSYRIMHLSTHADTGGSNPWIACKDASISLNEIYATQNQSDMVVLSACKTSLGTLEKGEGIMSLARGFFHSGAKSVLSSLWSTNDKSNQEILFDFYKGLQQGFTKSTALRKAKLKYIQTHHGSELSPFYWGSLILIGDASNISLYSNNTTWNWLWIAVLPLFFIFLYMRKRSKT